MPVITAVKSDTHLAAVRKDMPKFGYMLIQPGKPAICSDLLWDNAEDARSAGEAAVQPCQRIVVIENREEELQKCV